MRHFRLARWVQLILVTSLLGGLPTTSPANGGGYDIPGHKGGEVQTGGIKKKLFVPEGLENVRMVEEHLQITLLMDSADIHVRYKLHNDGPARTITLGFPVETGPNKDTFMNPDRKSPPHLNDYQISLDGKAQSSAWQEEPIQGSGLDERRKGIQAWQVSKLELKANADHELDIRCRATYQNSVEGISNTRSTGPRHFAYRFSTAAVWKGPIAKGRVEIFNPLPGNEEASIKTPSDHFKKHGNGWLWEFTDLKPTVADDLLIDVSPAVFQVLAENESHEYTSIGKRYFLDSTKFTATASSTLAPQGGNNYEANNIAHYGPWVAGRPENDSVGETLSLKVQKPRTLTAILLYPGYHKSEDKNGSKLWKVNNRVAKVEVTLNGNHTFTTSFPDEEAEQQIPVRDYQKPVESITLKILAVYKGTKFRDTAISQVTLRSSLSHKPKSEPVR